jgi:hypothetical protein
MKRFFFGQLLLFIYILLQTRREARNNGGSDFKYRSNNQEQKIKNMDSCVTTE